MLAIRNAISDVLKCLSDIRNRILWKTVERKPAHIIAFFRFAILRLTLPTIGNKKHIDPFIPVAGITMHDMCDTNITRREPQTGFFSGLPYNTIRKVLSSFDMSGNQRILSILIAGIETAD